MRLLERSLANLQTDYLDTRQLHNLQRQEELDRLFARDGAVQPLVKARDQGILRCLGVAGHFEPEILIQDVERFPFGSILMGSLNFCDCRAMLLSMHKARGLPTPQPLLSRRI